MATTITDVLNQWADMGVFAYVLPFLMIFAIIYGILTKTEILGKNRGVNATIALAAGLLALQFDYVPKYFSFCRNRFGCVVGCYNNAWIIG